MDDVPGKLKHLVLFGAGASFGAKGVTPDLPPLGPDLFDRLVSGYSSWASLPASAKSKFLQNRDFEEGLVYLRTQTQLDLKLPRLLRDLALFFLSFKPTSECLYHRITDEVIRRPSELAIATLNYDMLIERCFQRPFGYRLDIDRQHPSLLKIHGSPNFIPQIPSGLRLSGAHNRVNLEGPCEAVPPDKALEFLNDGNKTDNGAMVPSIALYAPGKDVLYCPNFVSRMLNDYLVACSEVQRISIVGIRYGPDDHVWNPIADSKAEIMFYNPSAGDAVPFMAWASNKALKANWIQGGMQEFIDAECN